VTRSVLAVEILALVHDWDNAFVIKHTLKEMFGNIPVDAFVDSPTTFDCVEMLRCRNTQGYIIREGRNVARSTSILHGSVFGTLSSFNFITHSVAHKPRHRHYYNTV
jgi:hypothetical protein